MIPLGLCRTGSSCCPPGSRHDPATECRGSFVRVIVGVEKRKRTLNFSFPHLPEQQSLPTRLNTLWAGVRGISEVLILQEACEVCFEKTECAENVLKKIPAALSLHWRGDGLGREGGGKEHGEGRTMTHARVGLAVPYSCSNTRPVVSVSPGLLRGAVLPTALPRAEARAPLPHSSERCEMAAAALGAARRKRRLCRPLSLPARAAIAG